VQFAPDSGATNHMVSSADYLTQSINPVKGCPSVQGIDGKSLEVMATGSMLIRDCKGRELLLTEVLLVPDMHVNVISVSKLTSIGLSCIFKGDSFRVEGGKDNVLYESVVNGVFTSSSVIRSLYSDAPRSRQAVEENGVQCFAVSFERWHQRLGHPSPHVLQNLVTQNAAIGLGVISSNDMPKPCLPCLKAKQRRVSHSPSQSVANCVLQLIHCDLMGPLPKSYGGSQYILAVLDDFSRFSRIECIEHKSDAAESLIAIIRLWECETTCKVQIVRTDGGKEFCNQQFYSFCRSQGIRHQRTVPYTPEQNGKVERLNRDLMEKARAMMFHCGAPTKLWAEAVNTANRVRNVLPPMNKAMTPFELFYGRKPNISSLRVFGCMAHVHVPKEKRKKLDARSAPGMFVGYSVDSKAWRIAFQDRNYIKIVESDSVIFDEFTLGTLSVCSPPNPRDYADHVDINLSSLGEINQHPAPNANAANAAQNFDINNLPPLPSLTDEEIAALLDPSSNEEVAEEAAAEESTEEGIPEDPVQAEENEDPQEAEVQVNNPVVQEQAQEEGQVRASPYPRRNRAPPQRLGHMYNHGYMATLTDDPMTLAEVKERPDWPSWKAAMDVELKALQELGTFTPTQLPPGRKAIPCKWVFKVKRNEKGELIKYRARLVAKGFRQIAGKDFDEVFAPVSKHATFRMLLSIVASEDLELHHIDIKTAFMNGEIHEELYMQPPPGWSDSTLVWRLHKGVNGLKQAARAWNEKLTKTVNNLGFHSSKGDPSLFISGKSPHATYLLCYVDDILIAGQTATIENFKRAISKEFECEDMGEANLFLGMKIIRNRAAGELWLGQPHYTLEIIKRAGLDECRPRKTPMDANVSLSKDSGEKDPKVVEPYQELIGSLLYLSGCTRPDIAQAVGVLSRFMSAPSDVHLSAAKQVIRYLASTVNLGLQFSRGENVLIGYCDADYAGDVDKRKSTSGHVFLVNGTAISWASKLQPTVAMSTCEAEFVAAANAAKEALWLKTLLGDFTGKVQPVKLYVDNQGALKLIHHPHSHQRTKHIDIAYRFIQDRVERGEIICEYVETASMVADCITKAVPLAKLNENKTDMGLVSQPEELKT
jgi:hypothetical protein